MKNKGKTLINGLNFEDLENEKQNQNKQTNFEYTSHIVKPATSDIFSQFKDYTLKNSIKNNNQKSNKSQKISPTSDNKKTSIFQGLIGVAKPSVEVPNSALLSKKRILEIKDVEPQKKMKKKSTALSKKINKNSNTESLFLSALGETKENMEKAYEEKKRREKEKERESLNINELLQRNLMGNKVREFITQKEEEKERLEKEKEIKNNYLPIDLSIPIPHINPIRRNNLEKYKNFRPMANDIYRNVLSFNFYTTERPTEEVPNTFENEAHYRYIWITDFFNELKYCLLNEKIEKSELQNYEKVDIKINLTRSNDIDNKLTLLKINTNKKLYELKKRILKDNDIIAVYNQKRNFEKSKITLKNEYELNYFLGIVTREHDSNDLNLLVLREDYENYIRNDVKKDEDKDEGLFYDKKIKYLGSINSSLREYKALLNLELSNFTSIIKTDTIFLNNKIDDINKKPSFTISSDFYLSEKEKFLKNLQNSKIFNEPQKNAIFKANSMKNNEILLIQGPPGTGKTHTILGLVSLLLKNDNCSKILICAPSNAAIDEISARLATRGVFNSEFEKSKCKFLRFGLYDRKDKEKKYLETMNGKILEKYSLEYLSDKKYKKDMDNISERLENLRRQLNNYNKDRIKNEGYIKNTEAEITNCLKLFGDKKYQKSLFEHDILVSTPILCTTLNNAGNERLKRINLSYEYLIVDEASQCVEPSCLIPFCHNVKKLILVGDHMQLPATVFSPNATRILYNRSLFERLIDNKFPRYILTVQYRMQSNISEFISNVFYDSKLTNDDSHFIKINKEPLYSLINIQNNFTFFDIPYGEELFEEGKKSYYNKNEIKFGFILVKNIITLIKNQIKDYEKIKNEKKNKIIEIKDDDDNKKTDINNNNNNQNNNVIKENKVSNNENNTESKPSLDEEDVKIKTLSNYKFAIICAYKSQVMKFRDMKKSDKFFNSQEINDIEINTVDSFQGQERDIIIFSTVRANFKDEVINLEEGEIPSSPDQSSQNNSNSNNGNNVGIGFLNDFRRMNVGLSRAKCCCFVIGHSETLKNNLYWKKLINYCKDKNSFFQVEKNKESETIKNILKK